MSGVQAYVSVVPGCSDGDRVHHVEDDQAHVEDVAFGIDHIVDVVVVVPLGLLLITRNLI